MTARGRRQQRYDHRLKHLVQTTGNRAIAEKAGVPRSTLDAWLQQPTADVVTLNTVSLFDAALQKKIFDLESRIEILTAVMRLLLALIRIVDGGLNGDVSRTQATRPIFFRPSSGRRPRSL